MIILVALPVASEGGLIRVKENRLRQLNDYDKASMKKYFSFEPAISENSDRKTLLYTFY